MKTVVIGPEAQCDEDDVTLFAVGDVAYLKIDRRGKSPTITVRIRGRDGARLTEPGEILETTDFYEALEDFARAAKAREIELGYGHYPTVWERL